MQNTEERAQRMVEDLPYLMKIFHRIGPGAIAETSVSLPQFHTLAAFLVRSEWNLGELADFLHIRPPAASELVEKLVRADMLQRTTNPDDRRQTILTLTPLGSESITRRRDQLAECYVKMLSLLPPEKQARFKNAIADLAKIAHLFDELENR